MGIPVFDMDRVLNMDMVGDAKLLAPHDVNNAADTGHHNVVTYAGIPRMTTTATPHRCTRIRKKPEYLVAYETSHRCLQ